MVTNIIFNIFMFLFGILIGCSLLVYDAIHKGYMKSNIGKNNKVKWLCDITQDDIDYDKKHKKG